MCLGAMVGNLYTTLSSSLTLDSAFNVILVSTFRTIGNGHLSYAETVFPGALETMRYSIPKVYFAGKATTRQSGVTYVLNNLLRICLHS